ncbi:hypothetical protein D5R40_31480 [Okeania hirsuta]|uniref:Uncharacterized protein n=1 Tax=Okeania hirsuta TaxID=1458930 RepID=A0A3N6NW98_9CYAN|nr:hypothetical protein [Okeania hirsuta]RQH21585.1 hypothetical protein D5R40_31480 [Okeania hirsuta]
MLKSNRVFEYFSFQTDYHINPQVVFGYSTLAYIPEEKGSWALPLVHQRINGEIQSRGCVARRI